MIVIKIYTKILKNKFHTVLNAVFESSKEVNVLFNDTHQSSIQRKDLLLCFPTTMAVHTAAFNVHLFIYVLFIYLFTYLLMLQHLVMRKRKKTQWLTAE